MKPSSIELIILMNFTNKTTIRNGIGSMNYSAPPSSFEIHFLFIQMGYTVALLMLTAECCYDDQDEYSFRDN